MRRSVAAVVSGCLLIAALAAPPVAVGATTSYVNCGSGADLQAAIDAASPGDTLVISGTCVGTSNATGAVPGGLGGAAVFLVTKSLVLIGTGTLTASAGSAGFVLVTAGGTTSVQGLTILGGACAGIYNNSADLTLMKVTVSKSTGWGVLLDGPMNMTGSTIKDTIGTGLDGGSLFEAGPATSPCRRRR